MELTPAQLANNTQAITLSSSKVRLESLAVGQEVVAKVISTSPNGDVTLAINNAIVNAKTALALTEGQLLQLLVAQTGKQITLQLPQNVIQAALSQQLLRESLPKQQPLSQIVQLVQQVIKQADQLNLPPKVSQALQDFVQRLPTAQQLSDPKSLQQAIKESGLFLEKSITQELQGKGNVASNDLKVLLSQLRNSLVSERAILSQQGLPPADMKTAQQTALTPTLLSPQVIKQELAQAATTQAILQQQAATKNQATTTAVPSNIKLSAEQIETALNIKTTQPGTPSPAQTNVPTSNISTPIPLPLTASGKPVSSIPEQYAAARHASSIKEALAINTSTLAHSHESGIATRFNNLIELLDQLIKQVDSSVARTQLHQLNTLQDQDAGRMLWSMEIPVKQDDETHLVQLEIEKENAKQDSEAVVTVNLAVNLEFLGPVYSRITLSGNNISVVFWAEQERAFSLTQDNAPILENSLEKSGFNRPKINCHHGQPPQMRTAALHTPDKLLDIKV